MSDPPNETVSEIGPTSNVAEPWKSGPSTSMRAPTLTEIVIVAENPGVDRDARRAMRAYALDLIVERVEEHDAVRAELHLRPRRPEVAET